MNTATIQAASPATAEKKTYRTAVQWWLAIGVVMIFFQVVIGGITRLTGSGLSITKWEIVTGTLPPLSAAAWEEAFELYRQTPQYQKINAGMSMGEFQFIYFWEYFHRLWARSMGFVFLLPFLFFYRQGWLDQKLLRRLGIVVLLAAVVASFGWIMVASGLVNRPWVNAYKLTLHLSLALVLYSYLFWTWLGTTNFFPQVIHNKRVLRWAQGLAVLLALQIVLGGIVSGMKAALAYPTWPDFHGEWIPQILLDSSQWVGRNFVEYDRTPFMAALVQTLHRTTAYLLTFLILAYVIAAWRQVSSRVFRGSALALVGMVLVQVGLGIFTLLYSIGTIPVGLGVLHQAGALVLLSIILFNLYALRKNPLGV